MPTHSLTRWTLIRLARQGDDEALRAFVLRYRPPVLGYLRRSGLADQAEDLAQDVFLRFFKDQVLERADPARGRFRSLLFAVTRNVVRDHLKRQRALKRGGGAVPVQLDENEVPASIDEDAFDQEWVLHLLEDGLERLARDHPNYHQALRGFFLERRSQDEVAEDLGKTRGDIQNYVHRGKHKLATYLREAVWEYASSRRECDDELTHLSRFLGSSAP